jgi:hypothetical protein
MAWDNAYIYHLLKVGLTFLQGMFLEIDLEQWVEFGHQKDYLYLCSQSVCSVKIFHVLTSLFPVIFPDVPYNISFPHNLHEH